MSAKRTIKVFTFWEDRFPRKPRCTAYTMWANEQWPGCRVYEVEATSGAEAKKIAIALRRQHEARRILFGESGTEKKAG